MPKEEPKGARPTKLRIAGIVIFALGVIVVVGGALKFIPGGFSTGGLMCLAGVVTVGLSFIRLPAIPPKENPLSLFDKVIGIFFEPSRVFRNLREHPHWVSAFAIICVLTAAYSLRSSNESRPSESLTTQFKRCRKWDHRLRCRRSSWKQ
jgi:drug/metabolite transporter (DMT)-like permease